MTRDTERSIDFCRAELDEQRMATAQVNADLLTENARSTAEVAEVTRPLKGPADEPREIIDDDEDVIAEASKLKDRIEDFLGRWRRRGRPKRRGARNAP